MMKISDPLFWCYRRSFAAVFENITLFTELNIDTRNGLGDVYAKNRSSPTNRSHYSAIENGPGLAMVNSDKGITNLHVPSDVIVDASMPAMIRTSECGTQTTNYKTRSH
jgi:isocitrate dehydrogenase